MIRLAFCIDTFEIGGTELNAVRWAERLSPHRFELTVVHFQEDGPLRARYERAGVRLLHVPLHNMYGPGAMRQGLRLSRFLARAGIEVFHTHDLYSNIFGVPWARLAGVPAVIASRRWWKATRGRAHQIANRWACRAAHRVLANSPSVAAMVTRQDGVPAAKVVCIPNSLAEEAFRPLSPTERAAWRARLRVPADALVIGIVARLDPDKDYPTLLEAFARIARAMPHAYLLCIGDGPLRSQLIERARGLQLNGRVQFPGTVTPTFNLHQLFDVSVLCSVTEAFPNSVLEAMAAARPVVATRVGGVPDVVRDGDTGVLVPAGDPAALAAALQAVMGAPDHSRRLGAEAQAHVRAEFHETRVIERLRALYESIVPEGGGGGGRSAVCGIAGFAGWPLGVDEAARTVRAMCDAILHRGPDDSGYFVAPEIALGMRRLSIIDVAGGQQPIGNEDGSVQVVFNGEIYNHHELRRELVTRGHRFRTRSDTETIVHLYEEMGEDFVVRLRGMFAIALWDARTKRLVLARDRLGIKPLSYWLTPDGIAFCSELRSLLALSRFPGRLDERGIAAFLSLGYVPDPLAAFAGVAKLPPGHVLVWTPGQGATTRRYWTPMVSETVDVDEAEAVERLQALLADAVGSHLESEVPLGAFLSGGLDSSTVVSLMARTASIRPRTFSIGFDNVAFNEAPHARRVAEALGTEHTDLVVAPEADRWIEGIVGIFDEPFADSSALPTYVVSWLARRDVTVSLSGDGGDELFGGYTRYLDVLRRPTLPGWARPLFRSVGRALPHITPGRGRLLDYARSREAAYAGTLAIPLTPVDGGMAAARLVPRDGEFGDIFADAFADAGSRDFVSQMMLVDVTTYLPGDILTKVDRASMAVSLEARVPLLDHPLAEFALALPAGLKIHNGASKQVFRHAIREMVPPTVLDHPKRGFAVPLHSWFRGPLRHRIDQLATAEGGVYDFLDRTAVRRLVREHLTRRRDHSTALWRALVLQLWLGHLDAGRLARPVAPSLITP